MEKQFEMKENGSVDIAMLQFMHPAIVLIVAWTNLWCLENKISPVWTSWQRTEEENKKLGATNVHVWRAADLSLKAEHGWNKTRRLLFEKELNKRFLRLGAFTASKTANRTYRKVLVRHDIGHGDHYHLQVSPYASASDLS